MHLKLSSAKSKWRGGADELIFTQWKTNNKKKILYHCSLDTWPSGVAIFSDCAAYHTFNWLENIRASVINRLTYWGWHDGHHFADNNFDFISSCETVVFQIKFIWVCSKGSSQQQSVFGSYNGLVPNRRQVTIWTKYDIVYWTIYAPHGPDKLIEHFLHIITFALSVIMCSFV